MNLFLDAFWRALAYCLRPRVMLLSLLPLLLLIALAATLRYFFWEGALAQAQAWLNDLSVLGDLLRWLDSMGSGASSRLQSLVAPLLVLMLSLPLIIIVALLAVSWFMTPALVTLVAQRRFAALEQRHGGAFWRSVLLGLSSALLAIVALLISLPLWLIPPLAMVVPPLIWGWLAYRVTVYDVLAEHASWEERAEIIRRHRPWLLLIGLLTGYLGAAPGMVWAIGIMAVVLAPLLVPLAIWIYTLVFAFSSLWFAHFCLAALAALRAETATTPLPVLVPPPAPDHAS